MKSCFEILPHYGHLRRSVVTITITVAFTIATIACAIVTVTSLLLPSRHRHRGRHVTLNRVTPSLECRDLIEHARANRHAIAVTVTSARNATSSSLQRHFSVTSASIQRRAQ